MARSLELSCSPALGANKAAFFSRKPEEAKGESLQFMAGCMAKGAGPESLCLPRIKDPAEGGADRRGRGKVSQARALPSGAGQRPES